MAVSETPSRNVITGFTKPFNDTKGRKKGHGDELIVVQEDEEGIEYPVVKLECFFLSFFRRCQRHSLYTEIGVVEMCDAHSVFLEFSSLTEDMRAT